MVCASRKTHYHKTHHVQCYSPRGTPGSQGHVANLSNEREAAPSIQRRRYIQFFKPFYDETLSFGRPLAFLSSIPARSNSLMESLHLVSPRHTPRRRRGRESSANNSFVSFRCVRSTNSVGHARRIRHSRASKY